MKSVKPTTLLERAETLDDYELYHAALEWNLEDPILIKSREDMQSEPLWRGKVSPYEHQIKNLITFCRRLPVTLLADDVGLGKTISAGLIISELIARRKIERILIVCPKMIVNQWKNELQGKFGIESVEAIGKKLPTAILLDNNRVIITTYQSAEKYLNGISENINFQMLILDEAHKLRNLYGTAKPPNVAICFRNALENTLFKYVLMLTATPIQNRLWDIYSLIELLTIARGHINPFGDEETFVNKYIADTRRKARELNFYTQGDFRSIVSSHMSRIRREDVDLLFPERVVLLHKVDATTEEMEILSIIHKGIRKLNSLEKSSILQAFVSSPHALATQLKNSSLTDLSHKVNEVINRMQTPAKLEALLLLINDIQNKQSNWRIIVFTERRATQSIINNYLLKRGISVGLINGDSGNKNQETISKFWMGSINIIISTRAGSEGVNLQIANVLVNYDLPWNPMIVEQRIGRVQRLDSTHKFVCIYNLVLRNTYDEKIVGRLFEKIQLATDTIGDLDSILSNSERDEYGDIVNFEEEILRFVLDSLDGKNVEEDIKLKEESIANAKIIYEEEKKYIKDTLDEESNPLEDELPFPDIPALQRTMTEKEFTIKALKSFGARILEDALGNYSFTLDSKTTSIRFEDYNKTDYVGVLCKVGTYFFDKKLVSPLIKKQKYFIVSIDKEPFKNIESIVLQWLYQFSGNYTSFAINEFRRSFIGKAMLRVKIAVVCDIYERLLEIECSSQSEFIKQSRYNELNADIDAQVSFGLHVEQFKDKVKKDSAVSEFCLFYRKRLNKELKGAGKNSKKEKRIRNDFTPNILISLVGLKGNTHLLLKVQIHYKIDSYDYESSIVICPSTSLITEKPEILKCEVTGIDAPKSCFAKCAISGKNVLKHHLIQSEISDRLALSEYMVTCSYSGKKGFSDEMEISYKSGRQVASKFMKTSARSGLRSEPEYFGICEFTHSDVLITELAVSQISGKKYRIDEGLCSTISKQWGHKQEFIQCTLTGKPLLKNEAEELEATGKFFLPGVLELCEKTNKKQLPSDLEKCVVTRTKALKHFFVSSSISNTRLLKDIAIVSNDGNFCTPAESIYCNWSERKTHPNDIKTCNLTSTKMHSEYISIDTGYFEVLYRLLAGNANIRQRPEHWNKIMELATARIGKPCKVEFSWVSPTGKFMAVSLDFATWFGLKKHVAGLIYSIQNKSIQGFIVSGKREKGKWIKEDFF